MAQPVFATINARLDALERKVLGRARRRVSRKEKARLMGVTPRTVARHVAAGLIEPPDIENGRWYFWIDELEPPRPERGTADSSALKATRDPRLRKSVHTSPDI
jgi:hypothetical protein